MTEEMVETMAYEAALIAANNFATINEITDSHIIALFILEEYEKALNTLRNIEQKESYTRKLSPSVKA